jgi:hypothetical protein
VLSGVYGVGIQLQEDFSVRRAHYSNLAPGPYRFRVMASNNSGVWNEGGAALDFATAPAH